MAINLGEASEQKEVGGGPVPKGSIVKVKMEIRKPKTADPQDPAVTIFKSKLKGLDCEFTVVAGKFEGTRIWENLFLPPAMQTITLTKGQEGVCNGSFAKCRAVIEAARNLDPDDPAANRTINSWFDLHGLEFPVKVGIDKPKPGDQYINNNISKVVTPKDENFTEVMGGSEIITDEPFPEIPQQASSSQQGGGQPAWGQNAAPPPNDTDAPPEKPAQQKNVPAWAQ